MGYEQHPRKQAICLEYGAKLRSIRGLKQNARHALFEAFSQDEISQIETICNNAESKAEKVYNEQRQHEAETSGRTSEEQRQYVGK
jgi:hypothetical protein